MAFYQWMAALTALAVMTTPAAAKRGDRDRARLEKLMEGRVAGSPQTCLNRFEAEQSGVYDGVVIFRRSSRLLWKNTLDRCPLLRADDVLINRFYGTSRVCKGDVVEIVDRNSRIPKGTCAYGPFVPYRKGGQ